MSDQLHEHGGDADPNRPLDEMLVPAGTPVKIHGLPFGLKDDTVLLGRESNYRLALQMRAEAEEARLDGVVVGSGSPD